jgi:uncharacterized membrane protein YedE/YeeE
MKKYQPLAAAFIIGLLFALGLAISGMTQPQKVIGFLQISKAWDSSLLFVMIAAVPIHFVAYRWARNRRSPLFETKWHIPQSKEISKSLVVGSAMFGFGWALAGYCPGPALVSLASLSTTTMVFVASMIVGIVLFKVLMKPSK